MKRLLLALLVSFWTLIPAVALGQSTTPNRGLVLPQAVPGSWGESYNNNFQELDLSKIPRVTNATKPTAPEVNEIVVVTDAANGATCTTGGGSSNNTCQWTGSQWVVIGGSAAGAGIPGGSDTQVQFNDGGALFGGDAGLSYNKTTDTLSVTGNVAVAGQSVCRADGTNCPAAAVIDPDITALAANTTAGFWAAATNVVRSMATASANNITITNPAGVAGNPTWDVGPNVALTTRSFTAGNFDYSFQGAASLTPPNATGAAPTTTGRIAFDTSGGRLKYGANGSTFTIANTGDLAFYQPLHANLTAFAGLTGAANVIPRFTSGSAISPMTITACPDTGGNTLNFDGTNIICGHQGGSGFTNGVNGTFPVYASASTMTPSLITQAGGTVSVAGNLAVNCTTDCVSLDMSAYAGHVPYSIPVAYGNVATGLATIPVTVGARTNGNQVVFNSDGAMIAGGAPGIGTVTPSTVDVFTNKTINVESTGNVITTVQKIWLPAAGGTVAAPGLLWDAIAANSPTPVCSVGATEATMLRCTADFPDADGDWALQQELMLPSDWTGAIDVLIKYRTTATSGNTVWQIATACRADAEVDDVAFNTADAVTADAAKGTTNQLNDAAKTGITTTGCAAGELLHLKVFRNRTNASDTITGIVSLVGVEVTTRRAQ